MGQCNYVHPFVTEITVNRNWPERYSISVLSQVVASKKLHAGENAPCTYMIFVGSLPALNDIRYADTTCVRRGRTSI